MAGYDGAGSIFALGIRLTRLDTDGSPLSGAQNCYVTEALAQIGIGSVYSEPDPITLNNGKGQPCVFYAPSPTITNGIIEDFQLCTPDPVVLQFCCGGNVISDDTGTDEVQTGTITGTPTGGTFTLTFEGETTGNIAHNATGTTVQTALRALSTVGADGVTVTGAAGGPYVVTFGGALGDQDVPLITVTPAFTGGTTPALTFVVTTPGVAGNIIGYRPPAVGVDPTPNGVAIEAWSSAIIDGANAPSLPYIQWVIGRAKLRPSENMNLGSEDVLTPTMSGTTEQNAGFGTGPLADIEFPTDRIWQYCRVATNPTAITAGYVTVP